MRSNKLCSIFLSFLLGILAFNVSIAKDKVQLGWLEKIKIEPYNVKIVAKLDTGAKTSSIHATNMKFFTKNGEDWVRFDVPLTKKGKVLTFTKEITHETKVKLRILSNSTKHRKPQIRPVVKLRVCIGNEVQVLHVNLANRSNFNYPVLLGRTALMKFNAVVNSKQKFTKKPAC